MIRRLSLAILATVFAVALFPLLAFAQDAVTAAPKISTGADVGLSLYVLLYPVLAVLTGLLAAYLKKLGDAHIKNVTVRSVLGRFTDSLFAAVKMVEGTLKAEIVKAKDPASPGGVEITPDEAAHLRSAVVDELKAEYGGMEGVKAFLSVLGLSDVEGWLNTRIEAAVHDVNLSKAAATANP